MTTEIYFHDVGAGHAVHAFMPNGKLVVIDLGCSADFSPLAWLKKVGRDTIDHLVITHPHGDHINEILLLDKLGFTVHQLSRPKWLTEQEVRDANQAQYKAHVDKYVDMNGRFTRELAPEERIVDNPAGAGGALMKTFWSSSCGRSEINNHSGVVSFSYATSTVVIPGDNEPASWRVLLEDAAFVATVKAANIFLASHHGRESGYCADVFADDRKPNLFVISDGKVRDTDASPSYSQQGRGWKVYNHDGTASLDKNVVTTRRNGRIDVQLGFSSPDRAYRSVKVETLA